MKTVTIYITLLLIAVGHLVFGQRFEGTVQAQLNDFRVQSKGSVVWSCGLKGIRVDFDFVSEGKKINYGVLAPFGKDYAVLYLEDGVPYRVPLSRPGNVRRAGNVKPTGNIKTLLGYECAEFEVTVDGGKCLIWATRSIGVPMADHKLFTYKNYEFGLLAAAGYSAFPLHIQTYSSTDQLVYEYTVTSVQQGSVSKTELEMDESQLQDVSEYFKKMNPGK